MEEYSADYEWILNEFTHSFTAMICSFMNKNREENYVIYANQNTKHENIHNKISKKVTCTSILEPPNSEQDWKGCTP
jgi:hypothetical protein